jgi:hypothetical protein
MPAGHGEALFSSPQPQPNTLESRLSFSSFTGASCFYILWKNESSLFEADGGFLLSSAIKWMYNALVNMNCFLNELRCNEASVKRYNGYHMKCTIESVCLASSACAASPSARQGRGCEEKKMRITSAGCGRAWSCARLNSTHCIAIPPS